MFNADVHTCIRKKVVHIARTDGRLQLIGHPLRNPFMALSSLKTHEYGRRKQGTLLLWLLCDLCDNWSHTRCVGVSETLYRELCEVSDEFNWHCPSCLFQQLPCSDVIDDVFNPCDSLFDSVSSSDSSSTNSHSLSCICLNSRSIMNKVLDFEALIATDSPDIVAVTETFLDCSILDCEFFPKSFQLFRCDRSHHGGGVMIAVRESVPSIRRFDLENPDVELLWLQITCRTHSIMFGVFYRPPNAPDSCLSILEASIQSISTNSTVVLCGDFNIHKNFRTSTSSDKAAVHLCYIVNNFSFQQLILDPTRGANILNLLLTNDSAAVTSVDIIGSLPSCDHEALKFSLCLDSPSQPKTDRVLLNFKAADFDHIRDILDNVPWQLSESDDVDVWWTQWKNLFLAAAYDTIPSVKWKRHKMKSWLSYDTIKLIKRKGHFITNFNRILTYVPSITNFAI